jgi:hypothetical protein
MPKLFTLAAAGLALFGFAVPPAFAQGRVTRPAAPRVAGTRPQAPMTQPQTHTPRNGQTRRDVSPPRHTETLPHHRHHSGYHTRMRPGSRGFVVYYRTDPSSPWRPYYAPSSDAAQSAVNQLRQQGFDAFSR